jgi:transposase
MDQVFDRTRSSSRHARSSGRPRLRLGSRRVVVHDRAGDRPWRHAVLAEHRRVPGRKQSTTRNLLERLRDRDEQVLLFARDLPVPFSNNQAERDLRPTKTQMKISGCHRSADTARAWPRIRSYICTVRKHGADVLTALRDAITGTPWLPPYASAT